MRVGKKICPIVMSNKSRRSPVERRGPSVRDQEQPIATERRRFNALWWWIDRWRKSTAYTDMTLEEQGAYRNLLDEAALRGGAIPDDERILAKASGDALSWKRIKPVIMPRFYKTSDGWRNETLDGVLRESQVRADKQKRYRQSLKDHSNAAT
jgi:uncharacterized protein YdaU (DUF1376 family)